MSHHKIVEQLTRMWRAASFNQDTVGTAIDYIEELEAENKRLRNELGEIADFDPYDADAVYLINKAAKALEGE